MSTGLGEGGGGKADGGGLVGMLLSKDYWNQLLGLPCTKHGLAWGAGVGALMTSHNIIMKKSLKTWGTSTFIVLSIAVGGGLGFVFCARELNMKYQMTREGMEKSGIKEDLQNK